MECALVPRLAAATRVALGSRVRRFRAQRLHVQNRELLLVRPAVYFSAGAARRACALARAASSIAGRSGPRSPPTAG